MAAEDVLRTQKIGFLGAGNLGQAMIRALLDSGMVSNTNIFVSNRTERKLQKVVDEFKVNPVSTNERLIDECDTVVIGVKPQDLYQAIEPIASSFHSDHVVISLSAGISLASLQKLIPNTKKILRVMPNTAAKVKKSVIGYSVAEAALPGLKWVETFLSTMGYVVRVNDDDQLEAITVGSSSGVGFVFELLIYWQEWLEERGIESVVAKKIAIQVFAGAAKLAEENENVSFEELQRKVASVKGVTAAGLDSMRELEIERALRISFEKAAMRDKELGQNWINLIDR